MHSAVTSAIFLRSASKFRSFDFLLTILKQKNIKMIFLFGHQNMAKGTFIRLQLRQSSCDLVQSGQVLFSSPYL